MTMTTRIQEPIGLIVDAGRPASFVWRGERWQVTAADAAEVEFLPTHGSVVIVWSVTAQTDAGDDVARLIVRRSDRGWLIDTATYS